jgi:hypothetical protein
MRQLKDGSFKYKPSAVKAAEWMQQPPLPMRSFRKNTFVKVFMGAGWSKGKVVEWTKDGVTVRLAREQRNVIVRDNRNIKEESEK